MTQSIPIDAQTSRAPATSKFNGTAFQGLAGAGMLLGLAIPAVAYFAFRGSVVLGGGVAERLAYGIRWMAFPALSIVLGFQVTALARFKSSHVDGSAPADDSQLAIHRRYLQNTLEQFAYFFVVQMALVTLLPADALHLTPVFAVQFLVGRLLFWRGYVVNPAYRSLGLALNHPNMLVLGYVLFRVVTG